MHSYPVADRENFPRQNLTETTTELVLREVLQTEGFRFNSWQLDKFSLFSVFTKFFWPLLKKFLVLKEPTLSPLQFVCCRCHWAWPPEDV